MQYFKLTRRSLMVLSASLAAGALPVSRALAHAHLKASVPAAESTVAAPASLRLTFSEGISLKFSGAAVTGPDKAAVTLGAATLDPKDPATLIVPVSGTLQPGKYTVSWHALSNDGHKTTGGYVFTVK